ncbi:hypothetical protein [Vibrio phage RYC]|nr:hypothetical protein [Vibrio phage RYC]
MSKKSQPKFLTYYAPHRCIANDTQDLYLGFQEFKPILSKMNQVQIKQSKMLRYDPWDEEYKQFELDIELLMQDIELMLQEEVKQQLESEGKLWKR